MRPSRFIKPGRSIHKSLHNFSHIQAPARPDASGIDPARPIFGDDGHGVVFHAFEQPARCIEDAYLLHRLAAVEIDLFARRVGIDAHPARFANMLRAHGGTDDGNGFVGANGPRGRKMDQGGVFEQGVNKGLGGFYFKGYVTAIMRGVWR